MNTLSQINGRCLKALTESPDMAIYSISSPKWGKPRKKRISLDAPKWGKGKQKKPVTIPKMGQETDNTIPKVGKPK